MARAPILAAGGIVVRGGREPLIAVVQLRKQGQWVLPKGKLSGRESALAAARREVLEETGHEVSVHEFLGTMSYDVRGRPKIVQFWRMRANGEPVRRLMHDVKAVRWLPLEQALDKLTHPRERVFLANVAPIALKAVEEPASGSADRLARQGRVEPAAAPVSKTLAERIWAWLRRRMPGGHADSLLNSHKPRRSNERRAKR
jgi:8-oxo-dGTP diphosphatase